MTPTRTGVRSRALAATALVVAALIPAAGVAAAPAVASPAAASPAAAAPAAATETQPEHLQGTLLVTRTEPVIKKGKSLGNAKPKTSYSVLTSDGRNVPITGKVPSGATTGAQFDGSVAVPTGHSASPSTSGSAAPLTVTAATVTPSVVPTAQSHVLDLVVINPAGVAPVDASYSTSAVTALATHVTDFWHGQSSQYTTDPSKVVTFTTTPTVPVLSSAQPCSQDIVTLFDQAAVALGYTSAQNYLDTPPAGAAHHLVLLLPPGCQNDWTGISTIGDGIGSSGLIEATLGIGADRTLLGQGIGVNFGVGSSDLDFCTRTTSAPDCSRYSYGDGYDVMGFIMDGYDNLNYLNPTTLVQLGWAPAGVTSYALSPGEATRTFTSVALPWRGDANRPGMIAIVDPVTQQTYYLEYRSGTEWDSTPGYADDLLFTMDWDGNDVAQEAPGVRLLTSNGDSGSVVVAQPNDSYPYNDVAALNGKLDGNGRAYQSATLRNDSGTIRVRVTASDSSTATVDVTLSVPQPRLHDYNGDNHPDLLSRNTAGALFSYHANGTGGWNVPTATQVGSGWNGMTAVVAAGDFDGDHHPDVLARDTTGTLWLYPGNGTGGWGARRAVGSGWNVMAKIVGVGDFNGDGTADVVAADTSGRLLLYPGNGTGGWLSASVIGSGWNGMVSIVGIGDFSGDGQADVLAEDTAGALWLYPHSLSGWSTRQQVGSGWRSMVGVLSVGDFDGDGTSDVIATDTAGVLWLYRGTGAAGFRSGRVQIGSGWGGMTWIG